VPNSPARDRLLQIILLTAGALSAAACCRVAGPCDRTAEAELAAGGTYTVNVHDERGRLDGVGIDPAGVSATETVSNPSDQPNVLLVTWEGSACDRQTDVGIAGEDRASRWSSTPPLRPWSAMRSVSGTWFGRRRPSRCRWPRSGCGWSNRRQVDPDRTGRWRRWGAARWVASVDSGACPRSTTRRTCMQTTG